MTDDKNKMVSIDNKNSDIIMEAVTSFLAISVSITLVKRVLSLVLIAADLDTDSQDMVTAPFESSGVYA